VSALVVNVEGSSAVRRIVGAVLVTVFVATLAVFFFRKADPADVVPSDEKLRAPWGCHACGKLQSLNPRERVELQRKSSLVTIGGEANDDATSPEEGRTSERQLILVCPFCGKMEFRPAYTCPRCHTPFTPKIGGMVKSCPICSWRPQSQDGNSSAPKPNQLEPRSESHGSP